MANLFEKSKKEAAKKVEKHEIVNISTAFEPEIARIAEIDAKIAELTAEKDTLRTGVLDVAKNEMIRLYTSKNIFPGSLKVVAGTQSFLFITADKYITITEERANELSQKYNEELVSENTVFSLNTTLVEKYSQVLSDLIMNSNDITPEDKENLIESKVSWSITKGTIEKLRNATFSKFDLSEMIEDIRPVFSVKLTK